jgi:hypothetical protein
MKLNTNERMKYRAHIVIDCAAAHFTNLFVPPPTSIMMPPRRQNR